MSQHKHYILSIFKKKSSHSDTADLLGFGFVFTQSQATSGMLHRSASPNRQNLSLPVAAPLANRATFFSQTLWNPKNVE
jgi:hypothetical protein